MNTGILTPERQAELKPFSPHARFEIPSEKEGREYWYFLCHLLEEMLTQQDARNQYNRFSLDEESGMEGGVGMVHMKGGEFISHFKLYWFDGTWKGKTPETWQKGLLLRNHEDMGSYATHQIFLLADVLASFLKEKKIPFEMFVRHRSDRMEIAKSQFP